MSVPSRVGFFLNLIRSRPHQTQMPVYESFESALLSSDSYEDPYLVEIVRRKTEVYRESLAGSSRLISSRQSAQNLFVLSLIEPTRPLNVLEIGGACGASYFEINHLLPNRIRHWAIVETPTMVNAGNSLKDIQILSFHTDLESAARFYQYDVVIIQGTLQYAPDPLELLTSTFALRLPYVYITRTVVSTSEQGSEPKLVFTKQETNISAHGPGPFPPGYVDKKSSQPMTIISRRTISASIPSHYNVRFWFEESDSRTLLLKNNLVKLENIGFLAARS